MRYSLLKWVSLSLSLDTRAVVLFLRLCAPFFFVVEQCDISPMPSFSLFSLGYLIAGYKDEMWGLLRLIQHHCGALLTKSPPGERQGWDEKWVCNPVLLCFSTSDTCLEPRVKAKTCSDSRLRIIHLCSGLSSHLVKTTIGLRVRHATTAPAFPFNSSSLLSLCYLPLLWSCCQKLPQKVKAPDERRTEPG